jgi:hypothetical protein
VSESHRAQFIQQRKGDQIVGTGQQPSPLLIEPTLGLRAVTLGAVAIAAGVVDVCLLPAVIALLDMASKVRRSAGLDLLQGTCLAGKQALLELCAIRRTMEADNLRHLQHEDLREKRSEVFHQLVERIGQGSAYLAS